MCFAATAANAQNKSHMIGLGPTKVLDTYLTPENFSGTGITYMYIKEQRDTTRRWSNTYEHEVDLSNTHDRSHNINDLEITYNLYWARYYNFRPVLNGLKLQAGVAANLCACAIYNMTSSNNPAQVGSSTMPQKRNPWNSEHVKSLWKAMCPRVITFYMDQISEHQRDLTNSASQRFITDYVSGFTMAVARMNSVVKGLQADKEGMARNLQGAGGKVKGGVLAEPAYILLGEAGVNDGHEVIRKITLEAEKTGKTFFEVLKTHEDVFAKITAQLEKLGIENPATFFENPANYCGLAAVKSKRLAQKYAELMK